MRRRLLRSCRGLVEIEDSEDLPSVRVTLLYRTVEKYVIRSQIFQKMIDKIDNKRLRDPAVVFMAMKLCLLKVYSEDTQDRYESLEFKRRYSLTTGFFLAMEGAERSTGCSQNLYIEELDRVLSVSHPDWTNSYYESGYTHRMPPDWNTNLLSLATKHNLFFYIQQQIRTNGKGIIEKAHGRPVLFYAFDDLCHFDLDAISTCELLLNAGANPMDTFGLDTVWSFTMMRVGKNLGYLHIRHQCDKLFRLMLELGAAPTQRVFRHDETDPLRSWQHWWDTEPTKLSSTVFHVTLSFLTPWTELHTSLLRSFVDHCDDFEATDSDGVGIQDWADHLDPEMGAFLRWEIPAKPRKRLRKR